MTSAAFFSSMEIQDFALWEKMKNKRDLFSFDLEITARCNNDCRHCYINLPVKDRTAEASELTPAEISRIADEAVALGAVWCLVTGGEPLLRKDFCDVYLALKRKGLLVSVFTNATLVTEEHIALFKKYPPRDIEVTVYGVTRDTYEVVTRRPGSFDRFMGGLNRLLESGVRVRLKAMAIQSNLNEQAAIAEFCRARTKDFYRFDPQLHLRFDRDPKRNVEIRAERLTPEQVVKLESADEERVNAMKDQCDTLINDEFNQDGDDHLFGCGTGNGGFTVGYDGTFRLCSSLWAPGTTHDLRKGSLRDACDGLVPRVRAMRTENKTLLKSCKSCPYINLCMWCPAHAYLETGDMEGEVKYFCDVAHARAAALKIRQSQTHPSSSPA